MKKNKIIISCLIFLINSFGIIVFSQEPVKNQNKNDQGSKEKATEKTVNQAPGELKPVQKPETLKWYTIEEAEKMVRIKPKKILIDVFTDWCSWCKKMDASTFNNPVIAAYIKENFYPVKFNAETTDTINFRGAKYINLIHNGKTTHPLAISLLEWRLSYPTIVYLMENLDYIGPIPGYQTAGQFEATLTYIAQEKFRTMSLEEFQKTFVGTVKP
jgi:thioredoxin-related protein